MQSGTSDGADGGEGDAIPHMTAGEGQDLYALPVKGIRAPLVTAAGDNISSSTGSSDSGAGASSDSVEEKQEESLPPGWEKHEGQ